MPTEPPDTSDFDSEVWGEEEEETTHVTAVTADVARELRTTVEEPLKAGLLVLTGANVGETFEIGAEEIIFGRGPQTTVRLEDESISRRHARVQKRGKDVVLEDLESANGTYVNNQPVTRVTLQNGDKVRLGVNTTLKFTYYDTIEEMFQRQMYDAALRDALTGAFNKKYLLDRLATELAYARRHSYRLSLVLFDVDHFKRVNDHYGHVAGDLVLAHIAQLVVKTLRAEDVFGRYGGEEFGVISRGISREQARVLGERLRAIVENNCIDYEGKKICVTISIGIVSFPESPYEEALQMVTAADSALYEAKKGGRNRVVAGN